MNEYVRRLAVQPNPWAMCEGPPRPALTNPGMGGMLRPPDEGVHGPWRACRTGVRVRNHAREQEKARQKTETFLHIGLAHAWPLLFFSPFDDLFLYIPPLYIYY